MPPRAFALEEAARCGDAVQVVTAWTVQLPQVFIPAFPTAFPAPAPGHPKNHAEALQEQALQRLPYFTGVSIASEVVHGDAGPTLVKASRGARLLVVGTRSFGPMRAALLGSVSRYCAQHATCPVVVVPSRHPRTGTVSSNEAAAAIITVAP